MRAHEDTPVLAAPVIEIPVRPMRFRAHRSDDPDSRLNAVWERRASLGEREEQLPNGEDAWELARLGGATEYDFASGSALEEKKLYLKGRRRVLCEVTGFKKRCSNTECGKPEQRYWCPFWCRLRYCPRCAPKLARDLMRRYPGLTLLFREQLQTHPGWIVAEITFTRVNTGRMPLADEVRMFNQAIKRMRDVVEREKNLPRGSVTLLWFLEFDPGGTYLHAHGLYIGPTLPPPRIRGRDGNRHQGKLSDMWVEAQRAVGFYALDAAPNIHVQAVTPEKIDRSFAHLVKYALKYGAMVEAELKAGVSPERMEKLAQRAAECELALHGVRRLHLLGPLYGDQRLRMEPGSEGESAEKSGDNCPKCGAALIVEKRWFPRLMALERGAVDLGGVPRARFFGCGGKGDPRGSPDKGNNCDGEERKKGTERAAKSEPGAKRDWTEWGRGERVSH